MKYLLVLVVGLIIGFGTGHVTAPNTHVLNVSKALRSGGLSIDQ